MSERERRRLVDILSAIEAIESHVACHEVTDELVYDAVRMRLLEIGEATKALPAGLLDRRPDIPWRSIMQSRDRLAHHYSSTKREIVARTVRSDRPPLRRAVRALLDDLPDDD